MRRKYRCYHDIVESILKAISEGESRITRICLRSNIPMDRCKKFLNILEFYGLITKYSVGATTYYVILDRGYEWLGTYEYLKILLPLKSYKG